MNKSNFNKLIDILKEEKLSNSERLLIKRSVFEEIGIKRSNLNVSWIERVVFAFESHALTASLVAVLIFAGAGVSFAAEDAIPGDILYSVKVKVNEELRDAISIYPEHRARWSAEKARRRLAEAQVLAERNELDEEKEEELSEKFASHTEELGEALKALEEEGGVPEALGVIAVAESTLETYRAIIAAKNDKEEDLSMAAISEKDRRRPGDLASISSTPTSESEVPIESPQRRTLLEEVENRLSVLHEERKQAKDTIERLSPDDVEIVVEQASEIADNVEEQVNRMYRRVKGRLTEDVKSFIEAEVQIGATYKNSADALVAQGQQAEAFTLYQKSININARLKEMLRSKVIFDGDISEVIDVFKTKESSESSTEHLLERSSVKVPLTSEEVAGTSSPSVGEDGGANAGTTTEARETDREVGGEEEASADAGVLEGVTEANINI